MSKEYYALIKEVNGREVFVSKEDPRKVVSSLKDALLFFSHNHIVIWRKCNPSVTNTIAVRVCVENDIINIARIE